jgi:protein-S-isoprenylcysteine O-methyltransferase Ste14
MTISIAWQFLYWLWVASEVVIGIATRTKRSSGNVQDRGSLLILWVVIFLSITVCIWISEATPPNMFGGSHAPRTTALIVLVIALAIRWSAILTLDRFFSSNVAILESQQLNQSGVYRSVRHPSYLGLSLVFVAIGLHSRNWLSLAIVVIPTTAAILYRIHVEESALIRAFGNDYVAYTKSTSRLIPGVF